MRKGNAAILSILLVLLWAASGMAALPARGIDIERNENGLFDIRGSKIPIQTLLQEMSRKAGVVLTVIDPIRPETLDLDLKNQSFEEVLRRVLKGYNYAVVYFEHADSIPSPIADYAARVNVFKADADPITAAVNGRSTAGSTSVPASRRPEGGLSTRVPSVRGLPSTDPAAESGTRAARHAAGNTERLESYAGKAVFRGGLAPNSGANEGVAGVPDMTTSTPDTGVPNSGHNAVPTASDAGWDDAMDVGGRDPRIVSLEYRIAYLQNRIQSGVSDREYDMWVAVRGAGYVTHDRTRLEMCEKQLEALRAK